jgi:hypothetical protein
MILIAVFMDTTQTISTQITLPIEVYQAIVQQARVHGNSIDSEIAALLISLVDSSKLVQEFSAWEAASDEDWLSIEATLASQEN